MFIMKAKTIKNYQVMRFGQLFTTKNMGYAILWTLGRGAPINWLIGLS